MKRDVRLRHAFAFRLYSSAKRIYEEFGTALDAYSAPSVLTRAYHWQRSRSLLAAMHMYVESPLLGSGLDATQQQDWCERRSPPDPLVMATSATYLIRGLNEGVQQLKSRCVRHGETRKRGPGNQTRAASRAYALYYRSCGMFLRV